MSNPYRTGRPARGSPVPNCQDIRYNPLRSGKSLRSQPSNLNLNDSQEKQSKHEQITESNQKHNETKKWGSFIFNLASSAASRIFGSSENEETSNDIDTKEDMKEDINTVQQLNEDELSDRKAFYDRILQIVEDDSNRIRDPRNNNGNDVNVVQIPVDITTKNSSTEKEKEKKKKKTNDNEMENETYIQDIADQIESNTLSHGESEWLKHQINQRVVREQCGGNVSRKRPRPDDEPIHGTPFSKYVWTESSL